MSTEKNYVPQRDSLASQVIGFFTNNPGEELSLDDITEKFMCTRGNVHTQLSRAVQTNLLTRSLNPDGDYIYRAGDRLSSLGMVVESNQATSAASVVKSLEPQKVLPLPELDAVVIEDSVPLPARGNKRDWTPLLQRLVLGQSFKLPIHAHATLRKNVTALQKASSAQYTIKLYPDASELRVWCTA
jgi:hypothetical protein